MIPPSFIKICIEEAKKSIHHCRVGAVIFSNKRIISKGRNHPQKATRNITKKFIRWKNTVHAEVDAIIKARRSLKGMSIIVIRINKKEEMKLAKPCRYCLMYIDYVGIKNIYYSTNNNTIEKLEN
jgi:deoxycytidylate deaminase